MRFTYFANNTAESGRSISSNVFFFRSKRVIITNFHRKRTGHTSYLSTTVRRVSYRTILQFKLVASVVEQRSSKGVENLEKNIRFHRSRVDNLFFFKYSQYKLEFIGDDCTCLSTPSPAPNKSIHCVTYALFVENPHRIA